MQQSRRNYKRIVVKIGSSFLCRGNLDTIDSSVIQGLAASVNSLMKSGTEVVLVSSGAIATGMSVFKLQAKPKDVSVLQALAAVGQHYLVSQYSRSFKNEGLECGQILLTWDDFDKRGRYLNAKNTINNLLKMKAVPIINENDTVSTDEIKFGDNDRLSALVASLVSADMLIILSDVDGLLDKDKQLIHVVERITPQIRALACPTQKKTCVGGMVTKLEAAKICVDSGIPCVIANGKRKDIIASVIREPQEFGTLFLSEEAMDARDRWIAFGTKPKGRIIIDDGAKTALLRKKSLLSVGVVSVEGDFETGGIVSVQDRQGHEIARGRANISSLKLKEVKGQRLDKEVIHCDNLVVYPFSQ